MKKLHGYRLFILLVSTTLSCLTCAQVSFKCTQMSENTQQITITISLKNDELLYADSITIEPDHPAAIITDLVTQPPTSVYDPTSKETKRVYENQTTIVTTVQQDQQQAPTDVHLHVAYNTNKKAYTIEKLIPLTCNKPAEAMTDEKNIQNTYKKSSSTHRQKQNWSISHYISGLLKTSNSLTLQLLLALLLGVLLSLTPCIYPMIPITVGILHNYGTTSLLGNAIRAVLYSMGMATTYAIFGLLASCTGPLCGHLLAKPIFIYLLVAFLGYMAGSMLGLYDLYIPRFLQMQQQSLKTHSLASIFLFGVVSGTIASPCVSPGLALILSVVATIGNKILGFLLLFCFGVGLSMPLLVVGTFSSSLSLLPRAGLWMVEIKKLFGFLLIGLCIYYLTNALPWNIILLISGFTVAGSGILYFTWAQKMTKQNWKKAYNIIGTCLLAGSVLLFINAAQETLYPYKHEDHSIWLKNYDHALKTAQEQNKLLFVDVWATFCSICIAINNSVLADENVLEAFQENYVLLKVDGTSARSEPYATLQQQYTITGFPTFLILNPETGAVIKRWGSEIYSMPKNEFIDEIHLYASGV